MKKIFVALATFLLCGAAFAQSVTSGTSSSSTQASTVNVVVGSGVAGSSGNTFDNTGVQYSGEYSVKSAPTVYAPNLTTGGLETCLGSVSAGVSFMGGGVAGGSTKEDKECNVRMTANVAWKMGDKELAVAVMCESPTFREAMSKMPNDRCAALDNAAAARAQPTAANTTQDGPSGGQYYRVADTSGNQPAK